MKLLSMICRLYIALYSLYIYMILIKSSHHPHFIDIESRLRKVANEEDENYSCEDSSHGVVPSVRVAGLEGVVEGSGPGYCSIDQPVED